MATIDELLARVDDAYARLEAPAWPNPHPGMCDPAQEEYSRLTEPHRYRIVQLRAQVWADVLREALGALAEPLLLPIVGEHGLECDRGIRITSPRPGTLPLLLLERETDEGLAVLTIGALRPELAVEGFPGCGCDACDDGSEDLLDAIDATIASVIGGPFVMLRGPGWEAQWHPEGGTTGSLSSSPGGGADSPAFAQVMEWSRRLAAGEEVALPSGVEVVSGQSWLG